MSTTISLDPPTTVAPPQTAQPSPSLPSPPRDWQAYRLVKVQLLSTRAAAEQLGISQTRVCQLLERVEEYLFEIAPGEETPAARAPAAEYR